MDIRYLGYALDRGIDLIIDGDPPQPVLPRQQWLPPPELRGLAEVERMLAQVSLDDALELVVRPRVSDPNLLSPANFRDALDAAEAWLAACAQRQPDAAKVLRRGLRMLGDERPLRDLLQTYLHALFPG